MPIIEGSIQTCVEENHGKFNQDSQCSGSPEKEPGVLPIVPQCPAHALLTVSVLTVQVIREALRLYSPLSFHYRQTVDTVDLGDGLVLPAGVPVIVAAYLTHRNPDYFPDPERFDPDRFLPENSAGRHPYCYIPFGLGRRLCVGHNFAMMETKTILSTVLRKFRACAVEGGFREMDRSVRFGLIQKPVNGFRISLVPRRTD